MLDICDLTVSYGGVTALDRVSIHIGENEIVTVVGANGAGKTTMLRAVSGVVGADSGEIWFKGKRLDHRPAHDVAKLGVVHVPEGRQLFGALSVGDNLLMGAFLVRSQSAIAERLEMVYRIFPRLRERSSQMANTMSGGEQQMLAIARGLMTNPQLLMLDEPSLGLAPKIVDDVFDLIGTIRNEGISILLVEQRVEEALEIADRAYILQTGRVIKEGTAQVLLSDPSIQSAYLGM